GRRLTGERATVGAEGDDMERIYVARERAQHPLRSCVPELDRVAVVAGDETTIGTVGKRVHLAGGHDGRRQRRTGRNAPEPQRLTLTIAAADNRPAVRTESDGVNLQAGRAHRVQQPACVHVPELDRAIVSARREDTPVWSKRPTKTPAIMRELEAAQFAPRQHLPNRHREIA